MLFCFADPKVATRNFVGIAHAQVHDRGAETNTRIVDMHPSRADLLTKYKLQSGPSQR